MTPDAGVPPGLLDLGDTHLGRSLDHSALDGTALEATSTIARRCNRDRCSRMSSRPDWSLMPNRACLDCGRLGPWGRSGRCDDHRRARQQAKDAQPARRAQKAKYDAHHRALRDAWRPVVEAGGCLCARCDQIIRLDPTQPGNGWDLGHQADGTPSRPEHAVCNRSAH